jgi:VCBS repeat-containing protein
VNGQTNSSQYTFQSINLIVSAVECIVYDTAPGAGAGGGVASGAVIGELGDSGVTEDEAGTTLTATGTLSIDDVNPGEEFFKTTETPAVGTLGSLSLAADGSYTYTVANSATQYLGLGETKTETFTVEALDGTTKQVSFTITGVNEAAVITGTPGSNILMGTAGDDVLDGLAGSDTLYGGADVVVDGGAGNDTLYGGSGADYLIGGVGLDQLWGNKTSTGTLESSSPGQVDTFVFRSAAESQASNPDVIKDFRANEDRIMLGQTDDVRVDSGPGLNVKFDANTTLAGDNPFTFAIAAGSTTKLASTSGPMVVGQLYFNTDATGGTLLADTTGDGVADFGVRLDGLTEFHSTWLIQA